MTQTDLTPNIQDLQQDVLELLKQVSDLLARSRTTLNADQYQRFEDAVNQEIEKVKNLELRMAIVAPMKAGKSTIINAIMGQDLLPSRNAAMTTVPTEIVFSQDVTEPTLTLDEHFCTVFTNTFFSIKHKIEYAKTNKSVKADIKNQLRQHPHLEPLAKNIYSKTEGKIPQCSVGRERIIRTLTGINDLVRLCNLLSPADDPLQHLDTCPRIEVNLEDKNLIQSGKLVIVDTPGPNEAGEHRLQEIVTRQLEQSSIVLLVLDFTQLKTQAAEKIKDSVNEITQVKGGTEALYVLVNKIDQRREGDMTTDEVTKFVTGEFGIDNDSMNRVFEIASRRAFCANNARKYLDSLANDNDLNKESKVIQALAEEIYGFDWKKDLQDATLDELRSKSERLWKKSGFNLFTENAIQALLQEAAPRCISTALNVTSSSLERLRDTVGLRSKGIAKDAGILQKQVKHIQQDLNKLKNCQGELKNSVDKEVNDLKKNIKKPLNKAKIDCEKEIANYFLKDKDGIIKFQKMLLTKIKMGGLEKWLDSKIPPYIVNLLKYDLALAGANEIKFETAIEANRFCNEISQEVKRTEDRILKESLDEVQDLFLETCNSLSMKFAEKTQPLVTAARNRLSKEFEILLAIPNLQLKLPGERAVDLSRTVLARKKNAFVRAFNWLKDRFGLDSDNSEYFAVALKDVGEEIQKGVKIIIEDFEKAIDIYIERDFTSAMEEYFTALEEYLKDFRTSLEESLEDKQRSSMERQEVETQLENTLNETNQILEKVRQKKTMLIPLLSNKKLHK